MISDARWLARWYWLALKSAARDVWDGLPGPWWAKILLILACTAIPGQADEIALVLIVKWARARKTRKQREGKTP